MRIKNKLATGFAAPVVILIFIGLVSYINAGNLIETAKWTSHTHEVLEGAETFLSTTKDLETGQRGFVLTGEERFLEPYSYALKDIYLILDKLKRLTSDNPVQQKRLEAVGPLLQIKIEELEETINLRRDVGIKAALAVVLTDRGKKVMDGIRDIMLEFEAEEDRLLSMRKAEAESSADFARSSILIGMVVAFITIVLITKIITHEIVSPLKLAIAIATRISAGERGLTIEAGGEDETGELLRSLSAMHTSISEAENKIKESEEHLRLTLTETTERVAKFVTLISKVSAGDLTEKIVISGDDDLSQLGKQLNIMTSSLAGLAMDIHSVTAEVTSTLSEVTSATSNQAASAAEQASAVNEITTTLIEVRQTSKETLDKSLELGNSALRTEQEGMLGLEAVGQAVEGMSLIRSKVGDIAQTILALSEQIQQIGEITGVVSNLSQQSKMLALNASIEAAKAGEAGKGFAVVAGEVRELAEQSQHSTEQVQKILQDIHLATDRAVMVTEEGIKGVDTGIIQVERTGEVMRVLSEVIKETLQASKQIVVAVRQETEGIDQVSSAMNDINGAVQQFSTSTQQTREANNNLTMLMEKLRKGVSVYKV